jgi:predicted transcriptional regulator
MLDRALLQHGAAREDASAAALFAETAEIALPTETCQAVAQRMASLHLERLPVVRDRQSMALVGVISRSDLVKPARTSFLEEHVRERMLGKSKKPA